MALPKSQLNDDIEEKSPEATPLHKRRWKKNNARRDAGE
jgi:hypothetical protein